MFLSCIFGKNDWLPIWSYKDNWKIITEYGNKYDDACSYEILYSLSRKRYKLKVYGRDPKEHSAYGVACAKMAELLKINTGEK